VSIEFTDTHKVRWLTNDRDQLEELPAAKPASAVSPTPGWGRPTRKLFRAMEGAVAHSRRRDDRPTLRLADHTSSEVWRSRPRP
jgi:hypothetical protein